MSSYPEVNAQGLGEVHEPTDEERRRAALNVAYRLHRRPDDTTEDDVLTVLRMCGLVDDLPPAARTDPNGRTIYVRNRRDAS